MRFYALILLLAISIIPALTQTKKPGSSPKPKAATPKPTAKKPAAKATPKATPKRPAAQSTPTKAAVEKADWDKAVVIEDARERISSLVTFLAKYPKSTRKTDALEIILKLRSDLANERLVAADTPAAVELFKAAVANAPTPVSDKMFDEILSKVAPNLYFRGATAEAVELQRSIEKLASGNVSQLLSVANFYLSIENGTEVLRIADELTKLKPDSAQVAQMRALGLRMQFQIDESEAAFAKAVELDPEFVAAKRGLAEAKRAAGKPDEAIVLYREILSKEPSNLAAKTGVVLAMFESGKRAEAEAEMEAVLKESASNVILLAGAAYWYASNGVADKAVEFGKRAVEADARFIWSHIACARGLAMQDRLPEAEKALLVARKYGNFPTLDLELAVVRMEAGYYREAAETLDQSFAVEGDKVSADLGFRVRKSAADLVELTSFERRSSIFAFRPALDLSTTEKLKALLEYSVLIEAAKPDVEKVVATANRFIGERDKMRPFRELYVASHFATKGVAPERVLELTKDVVPSVDAATSEKWAVSAILADEIYNPRVQSISSNEFLELPTVPKPILSSILRGRIEEINGIALLNQGKPDDAILRFRRSVGVLPEKSSWWRSATWRLGSALESSGKSSEALEQFYLSYRAGGPDPIKYAMIESTYRKVNGSTDGLVQKIGENPLRQVAVVPTATPEP
nr:tetratricopeptide repeat protein [Pyrinomonadaceae bacterium]